MTNIALDNRLFTLQSKASSLTPTQRRLLFEADVAYLQDREDEAEALVSKIEKELEG